MVRQRRRERAVLLSEMGEERELPCWTMLAQKNAWGIGRSPEYHELWPRCMFRGIEELEGRESRRVKE